MNKNSLQVILFLILFQLFFSCAKPISFFYKNLASDGQISLEAWEFEENGPLSLKGGWEYYEGRLLEPSDFPLKQQKERVIKVVDSYFIDSGYATFRLHVKNYNPRKPLAFKIFSIRSSYKLWVDNFPVASVGVVGTSKESSKPQIYQIIAPIPDVGTDFYITLQAAHFVKDNNSSVGDAISIGDRHDLLIDHYFDYSLTWFLIGLLVMLGLYHMVIFFQDREEDTSLYFSISCFLVMFFLICMKNIFSILAPVYLLYVLPNIFVFMFFYWMFPVFYTFLAKLFKVVLHNYILLFFYAAAGLATISDLIITGTKPIQFYYGFIILLGVVYCCTITGVALFRGSRTAWYETVGLIVLLGTLSNDILNLMGILTTGLSGSYGVTFYILLHAYIIARSHSKAVRKSKHLTLSLKRLNKNLEQKVEDRTFELREMNKLVIRSNQSLLESIEYARLIQKSILPNRDLFKDTFSDFFILWNPRDVVGGDFYWMYPVGSRSFMIAVIDCTGHGVPGALMTMMTNSILNHIAHERCCNDPARFLTLLDTMVSATLHQRNRQNANTDVGLDIGLCYFDMEKMELIYSGARRPLFYFKDGKVDFIKGRSRSIGYVKTEDTKELDFINSTIKVHMGDVFYLTSDGLTDQNGGENDFSFGKSRLVKLLSGIMDKTLSEQRRVLEGEIMKYRGPENQRDDMTMVGFKI